MVKCSQCQWLGPDDAQFCGQCGSQLKAEFDTGVLSTAQDTGRDVEPSSPRGTAEVDVAEEKNAAAMRLVAEGKISEALEELNEAIRLAPNHTQSYSNRADVLARMGMMSQAEADRRRAEQLAPRPAYAPSTAETPDYAGFWQRFAALLLDGLIGIALALIPAIIIGIIAYAAALPADDAFVTQEEEDTAVGAGVMAGYVVYLVIAAIYVWVGNSLGGTWGKRALGLRVVSASDRSNIGLLRGFGRYLLAGIGSIPLYLGWLWMLWDDRKQTWHDKAAGSIVVRKS